MPRQSKRMPPWVKYSGMGMELAAAVAGFVLVGVWVDRHYETAPWGVVIGAVLGLVGGMYNLIRESLAALRSQTPDDENEHMTADLLGELDVRRFFTWTALAVAVTLLVGFAPTLALAGSEAVAAMFAGCAIAWLGSVDRCLRPANGPGWRSALGPQCGSPGHGPPPGRHRRGSAPRSP